MEANFLGSALLVGVGGFVGSVARYGLGVLAQALSLQWPWGTLASNVLGSLVIGVVAGLLDRGATLSLEVRLLVATGFCGGFTTLSSLIYEAAGFARDGQQVAAAGYVMGTLVLSALAFVLGLTAVGLLARPGGA
jgi:CrcB protein